MLIGGAHPHGPPKPGPDEHEHSRSTYIYLEDQAQHDHLDIKQKEISIKTLASTKHEFKIFISFAFSIFYALSVSKIF